MTIDEAIAHARDVARINRLRTKHPAVHRNDEDEIEACILCAEEHEQLAEWLEELKDLRELKDTITSNAEVLEIQGYNKAIDDYMKIISKMDLRCLSCIVDCKFAKEENCCKSLLIYLAEQLKGSGFNE